MRRIRLHYRSGIEIPDNWLVFLVLRITIFYIHSGIRVVLNSGTPYIYLAFFLVLKIWFPRLKKHIFLAPRLPPLLYRVVFWKTRRTCGVHVFVFYVVALAAVLAMSTACLCAIETGYFVFKQEVHVPPEREDKNAPSDIVVSYEVGGGRSIF